MQLSRLAVLLSSSLIFFNSAHAAGRDPYIGQWGGECGKGVQCWIDVEKKGTAYNVTFVVADRMNAAKIKCKVRSTMTRGPVRYSPHETFDDALGGEFQKSVTYAALGDGPVLNLGGGLTAGLACKKYPWMQAFSPIGD